MRISVVPAQITTVEDKIAGNLSVQQGVLLGVPILLGFVMALILPPSGQFVTYKIGMVAVLFMICGALAFRIKGRIIAQWLVLFTVYCARPRYYVYDKNTLYLRPVEFAKAAAEKKAVSSSPRRKTLLTTSKIAPSEFARLERFATDGRAAIKFVVGKKGELHVRITEGE